MVVVLFDSGCAGCNAFRRWVESRDSEKKVNFVGNRTPEAFNLLPRITEHARTGTLHSINADGEHRKGAHAVLSTIALTGGWLGLAARLLSYWPMHAMLEPGYRLFARYRGWFGRFVDD
jgi:predicted DCC family thiol-disulfide oxidoreductase YuxK